MYDAPQQVGTGARDNCDMRRGQPGTLPHNCVVHPVGRLPLLRPVTLAYHVVLAPSLFHSSTACKTGSLFICAAIVAGGAYHGVPYGRPAAVPRNARGSWADCRRGWARSVTTGGLRSI